jgi:DNA-binding transcriptional LysR family regulator
MDEIAVFVEVVDAQSFTHAAQRLGMPVTTVSAKVARLEQRLAATLIRRTTRRLDVTDVGRRYYEHCVRALAEIAEAEEELMNVADEPSGRLRLSTPAALAQSVLAPLIERFLARYPRTSVELVETSRAVDFIAERIDLAIRVGPLEDSTLTIRKFRTGRVALWASPAYLERMGVPAGPRDLARHHLIRFSRWPRMFALKSAGADVTIDCDGRVSTDDLGTLRNFIMRGMGIGLLPEYVGEESAAERSLARVLPDLATETRPLYFAYPQQKFVPRVVRAFIEMATQERSREAEPQPAR